MTPKPTIVCADCSTRHPADEPCAVCEAFLRIKAKARANRVAYAIRKQAEREEKGVDK